MPKSILHRPTAAGYPSASTDSYLPVVRGCVLPLLLVLCAWAFATPASATLKPMCPQEMKETTAQQGFTQFVMDNNTARMFLDIHMETYTTMDALSGAYFQKGSATTPGWDQQWANVSLGTDVNQTLSIDGLVFIADFDDTTPDNTLQRVVFGSNRLQGALTATFNSYSGCYNNTLLAGGATSGMTLLDRQSILNPVDPGQPPTFHFNSDGDPSKDMGLFFILNVDGPQKGLQVVAGFDETVLTTGMTPWWDSP